MKVVTQSYEILYPKQDEEWNREFKLIEAAGRVSHQSDMSDSLLFIRKLRKWGHESVMEFGNMVVKFKTNRGVSHELVRHRHCSFLQQSTRYVPDVEFIEPSDWDTWTLSQQKVWESAMTMAYNAHKQIVPLDRARSVLPNSLATVIVVKANFREWNKLLQIRTGKGVHSDFHDLVLPLAVELHSRFPEAFDEVS